MLKVDEIKAQDQRSGESLGESLISAISRPLQMALRLTWLLGLLSLGCCPGGIMSFIVPSVVSRPCRRSVLPGTLRSTALASPTQAPAPLDFGEDRQGRIRLRYNPRGWNVWQHRPRLSPEAHGTLNIAMNRIGAKSVSGEGGEDRARRAGGGASQHGAARERRRTREDAARRGREGGRVRRLVEFCAWGTE